MLNQLTPLLPEIFLASIALFAFVVGMFSKPECQFKNSFVICLAGLISSAGLFFSTLSLKTSGVFKLNGSYLFYNTDLSIFAKIIIVVFSSVILIIAKSYLENRQNAKFEYNILFVFAVLGACVAVSTTNLIVMFIGLELFAFSLYILVGFMRQSTKAVVSANKYFILGCIASSMLLYGISLIYITVGSVSIDNVALTIKGASEVSFEYYFALVLIFMAIFFKLAIVPMQFYLADVLFAANRPTLAFISTISKIVGFIIFVLLFMSLVIAADVVDLQIMSLVLMVFSLINIFIGSVFALKEQNINKFIAYSSINNVGFMLIAASLLNIDVLMFYLINYCLVIVAFVCYLLSFKVKGEYIKSLKDLSYLTNKSHKFGILGIILVFTLAGVPPFAMFYAKFAVIKTLIESGYVAIAVAAVVLSVMAVAYCLRVVKYIYFTKQEQDVSVQSISSIKILTYFLTFIILIFSIFPIYVGF